MKKYVLIALLVLSSLNLTAQVGINSDGSAPDASAMLDVKSTTSGLLIPRMTAANRDNIVSPATGLLVYVTDDNSFYYFDGANWVNLSTQPDQDWAVTGNDMYSLPSGNVGIGTNSPSEKLEVNGNIKHGNALKIYSNAPGGTHTWASFNSPTNGNGDNMFLGAGGTTVLGSGEAAVTTKNNIDTTNGHETLYLASDNDFKLINNLQNGWNSRIEILKIDKDRDWHMDVNRIFFHDVTTTNHATTFMQRTGYYYGYGLAMSPGQGLAIGGGESAHVLFNNVNLKNTELFYLTSDATDNSPGFKFITGLQQGWNNKLEAMTILGNGKIGIGLNNPTGYLHLAYRNDAGPNGASVPGADFVIGPISGQHMEIDDNEIHSMSNASNGAVLYLNDNGDPVEIGKTLRLRPTGTPPSNPQDGMMYFDSNINKLRCYANGTWHNLW